MMVDSELKNLVLWYQMLETKVVSAEVATWILPWRTQRVYYEREREREQKAQEIVLYYSIWQQPSTRLQESVYILTDLGQQPFTIYKKSLNLDCPRDSVNTAIIHPYSTISSLFSS
mgnify:CR=1 FL=1